MTQNKHFQPILRSFFPSETFHTRQQETENQEMSTGDGTLAYIPGLFRVVSSYIAQPKTEIKRAILDFKEKFFKGFVFGLQVRERERVYKL